MLKAKLDSARKNKKGFSLVELIIVMAIMVALVAVMAPQFIKYVQRARDAVVTDAAENLLSVVKSEIALGHIDYPTNADTDSAFVIKVSDGKISITSASGISFSKANAGEYDTLAGLINFAGVDLDKKTTSTVEGYIKITSNGVATLSYNTAA